MWNPQRLSLRPRELNRAWANGLMELSTQRAVPAVAAVGGHKGEHVVVNEPLCISGSWAVSQAGFSVQKRRVFPSTGQIPAERTLSHGCRRRPLVRRTILFFRADSPGLRGRSILDRDTQLLQGSGHNLCSRPERQRDTVRISLFGTVDSATGTAGKLA